MAKKSILIADDVEDIRILLKTILEEHNYQIYEVETGSKVIPMVKELKPNLLILDIMMPEMDGWEICEQLRKKHKNKTPILMLTARMDDMSEKLSKRLYKVEGYITKPFDNDELIKQVKEIIK